jgi:hypothetical protein
MIIKTTAWRETNDKATIEESTSLENNALWIQFSATSIKKALDLPIEGSK